MINGRLLLSLGLMLVFCLLIIVSLGYNPLARMVPMVVAVPVFALTVVQFFLDFREALRKGRAAVPKRGEGGEAAENGEGGQVKGDTAKKKPTFQELRRREAVAAAWVLVFFALIILFGFQIAIALFVLSFTRIYGRESWPTSLGLAAICWALVYLIFVQLLKNTLYPGLIFQSLV